jgi:hypothetical protein
MQENLDLELWLDTSLLRRQNQLKADFLNLFEELGNSVTNEELVHFFPNSKGKKISKGNQLQGFPYFVLDLIRDFDLECGCNIRLVSWFGNGLYCCVFIGKKLNFPSEFWLNAGFHLGDTQHPWDLPAQIEKLKSLPNNLPMDHEAKLWIKEINPPANRELALQLLKEEVNKILQIKPVQGI